MLFRQFYYIIKERNCIYIFLPLFYEFGYEVIFLNYVGTDLRKILKIDKLFSLHYFSYAREFRFEGEEHDFWEFVYVDRGEVNVMADKKGYTLGCGEIIFHKPNEYHNIWPNGGVANTVIMSFSCHDGAMDFFKNKILHLSESQKKILGILISLGEKTFVGPMDLVEYEKLKRQQGCFEGNEQLIGNYLEIFLIELLREHETVNRISDKVRIYHDQEIVRHLKSYMENHLRDNLTFNDLTGELRYSKSYLTRLFRKETGFGIMEYYQHLRITEAKKLIAERSLSYTQIADLLGFSSIHYFSACFKKQTGMAPREYAASVISRQLLS